MAAETGDLAPTATDGKVAENGQQQQTPPTQSIENNAAAAPAPVVEEQTQQQLQTPAATPTPTPAPEGDAKPAASVTKEEKPAKDGKPAAKAQPAPKGGEPAAAGSEKKLTNAELKKRQKEEKAARRAAAKVAQPAGGQQPGQAGPQGGDAKGAVQGNKQKQGGGGSSAGGSGAAGQQKGGSQAKPAAVAAPVAPKEAKPKVPECFSHLSLARRIPFTQADKDVHPAVLMLGQYMSTFAISDSITRLETTLYAFKKVIESYKSPHNTTFSRHFTSHMLNPQIEYLTACRPMCFSMGNAVRWLKLQISKIHPDVADSEAKLQLCELIDNFIRERISVANQVIVGHASSLVKDDAVVLTYAQHHLVERTLLHARASGKDFSVVIIDDPYERVGVEHAKTLARAGIPVSYVSDSGALRTHLGGADLVLLAAEAMFSNGAMYARAGTSDIAIAAKELDIPVTALCETINFTERVSIDTLTYNEIDPERCTEEEFRLLFDTTRGEYITNVVTELGDSSSRSVPSMLKKLEEL